MTGHPRPTADHGISAGRSWKLGQQPWLDAAARHPRSRVIVDNDFIGDPDDIFQLVHHLLSPTVDVRLVIASHLHKGEGWDPSSRQAEHGAAVANDVFARMGILDTERILAGAEQGLVDAGTPQESPAARAIIAEAMRTDDMPLYYCAGGGLTDLASAILIEPTVAERLTLIWIGGSEHPSLATPPPGSAAAEYNLTIDTKAAQVIFGDFSVRIWQVPRDVYRQALLSTAELRVDFRPLGDVGTYLYEEIHQVSTVLVDHPQHRGGGDVYCMGDQPLVLLTALQSTFEPDPSSSFYVTRPTPLIADDGTYEHRPDGRPMRIYTALDNRLTFADFRAKLAELAAWQRGELAAGTTTEEP